MLTEKKLLRRMLAVFFQAANSNCWVIDCSAEESEALLSRLDERETAYIAAKWHTGQVRIITAGRECPSAFAAVPVPRGSNPFEELPKKLMGTIIGTGEDDAPDEILVAHKSDQKATWMPIKAGLPRPQGRYWSSAA